MSERRRLVIFDCDGTLADSEGTILAALAAAFESENLPIPPEPTMRAHIGLSLDHFIAGVLGEAIPPERHARLKQSYRDAFGRLRGGHGPDPLFGGLRELLEELVAKGYLLATATGKSRRGLRAWIDGHGLAPLFVSLQSADDAPSKPHPGMILNAMADVDASAEDTVMVGDTTYDIGAAVAAGVRSIGVGWGHHELAALREAGATRCVETVDELRSAIETLLGD